MAIYYRQTTFQQRRYLFELVEQLEDRLPPELRYIISDNGKQFIADAFQRLCVNKGIVHVRITL